MSRLEVKITQIKIISVIFQLIVLPKFPQFCKMTRLFSVVSEFSRLFLMRSFLYLQVTGTLIKSRTSLNFGQIGLLTTELAALERLKKKSHRLIMGKWCLHASSFIFDRIIVKVTGNGTGIKGRTCYISGLWCPWPIYMFFEMRGCKVRFVDDQKICF